MNNTILVSPTEPKELKTSLEAISSELCETKGVDFLTYIKNKDTVLSVGWQRKSCPGDLVSSIVDGRLGREISLMSQLSYSLLIIEGTMHFSNDGFLYRNDGKLTKFSKQQLRNLERSCKYAFNVQIEYTSSIEDTVDAIREMIIWLRKDKHDSLRRRPPLQSDWGVPSQTEQQLFFLQGIPKVGSQLAENIIEHFGGIPMCWACTEENLTEVNKIGKKKAHEIYKFLPDWSKVVIESRFKNSEVIEEEKKGEEK